MLTAPKKPYIIIENNLDKNNSYKSNTDNSNKNKMSNAINDNTKTTKLGTTNFCIKIHIPHLLILLNLFAVSFTKQKSTLLPVLSMLDPKNLNF